VPALLVITRCDNSDWREINLPGQDL